jgi:lipopolysaccharide export system permease protein
MQLLTRYVLSELLKVFLATLVVLTAMIAIAGVAREAVTMGLGIGPILRIMPYILPEAMRYAVPATVLLTVTSVYGRMAASNEIVAAKSLGISPMAFVWPLIVFASFVSLGTVWLNDVAVSWGRSGVNRVIVSSAEQIAYGMLQSRKSYTTNRLTINVRDVVDRTLIRPTFIVHATKSRPEFSLTADEAELRSNLETGCLEIHYRNATFDSSKGLNGIMGSDMYPLPLDFFLQRGGRGGGPTDKSLSNMPAEIARQNEALDNLREELATTAAFQMMLGDFGTLSSETWDHSRLRLARLKETLHRLHTEPHRRWANGFSCLCFALVGAPMAIRRRHGEFLASFFVVFLPILLVYYPLLLYGVNQAKHGIWPPACVWLGNLMLAAWSIWLFRRVIRY